MGLQKLAAVDCFCSPEPCIKIADGKKCSDCCWDNGCLYVCPAVLFEKRDGQTVLNSSGICLECGACRLVCDNIVFQYPPGGQGVIYRFG